MLLNSLRPGIVGLWVAHGAQSLLYNTALLRLHFYCFRENIFNFILCKVAQKRNIYIENLYNLNSNFHTKPELNIAKDVILTKYNLTVTFETDIFCL